MSSTPETAPGGPRPAPDAQAFVDMQASPEFQELRTRLRKFVFPMTAFFLVWYLLYVLLAAYLPEFMGIRIADSNITVGLVFGLLQFVSTFAIAVLYVRYANRELDPRASAIRLTMTGEK